jgi:hypothetical protein
MTTVRDTLRAQALGIIDALNTTDPGSDTYSMLLRNLEQLLGITQFAADALDDDAEEPVMRLTLLRGDPVAGTPAADEEVEPAPAPTPETPAASTPAPAPEAPVTAAEETPAYTREEVRAALGEARIRGVDVTALMKEFGVDRFPAFPVNRYGELMAKLEGAR